MSPGARRASGWATLAALLVLTGLPGRSAGDASAVPEALPGAPAFPAPLRAQLDAALAAQGPDYVPRTKHRAPGGAPLYTNRLLLEASPYLRQHAHNPVNWYPWSDEAFAAARRLGRPVLVSIGYSTCHWCHVMEEESFDDAQVAAYLNAHFIAIKVDRELRPDVDSIYMSALHALQGRGGWPLNAFVTYERKPFYAGSYFPRDQFLELLRAIQSQHAEDPARITEFAGRLGAALKEVLESARGSSNVELAPATLHAAVQSAAAGFDREFGGIGAQPKFPQRTPVRLLLRYHRRTGHADALAMATKTLDALARGGIHDQIGGGFHRYATDRRWLAPHFEKMLYTQAQLVLAYTEAWQTTGREDFADVVDRTLAYVKREMTAPGGGFYSATDADSLGPDGEREEGAFFTWTPGEVRAVLDAGDAKAALAYWGIREAGHLEGRSIPHAPRTLAAVASELRSTEDDLSRRLERARAALYAERQTRPPPLRDDKILAGWNGLMISAFARAGFAFANAGYTQAAARAADFALAHLQRDGRLQRAWHDGRAEGNAFLEDHAFLIAGLLDLYEASPDPRWLRAATALQASQDARFADEAGGGYYRTAADHEQLLAREKPWQDGSVPSGNSVAALNLLRLYEFTGDAAYSARAGMLFSALHELMARDPLAMAELLLAADFQLDLPKEVVVVKPEGDAEAPELLVPLRRVYAPNRILSIVREGPELAAHAELVPLVREKRAREGKTTVYVCENRVCDLPTSDPATLTRLLRRTRPLAP